jgi:hypothetical protein
MGSARDGLGARGLLVGAWVLASLGAGSVTCAAVATFESRGGSAPTHVLSQSEVRSQLVREQSGLAAPSPGTGAVDSDGPPTTPQTDGPQPGQVSSAGPPSPTAPTTAGGSPATGRPPTHATSSPPPTQPASGSRSWSFEGGRAGVECSGDAISLLYATPDDGWAYVVVDRGPNRVEVRFHEELTTTFTAHCAGGTPVAQIGAWGEGGDGGSGGDES